MLSIIIPTLNEEHYLPLLLREIKKQSLRDYEVIVADANSKDRTVNIAKSFSCKIVKGGLPAKGRNEGAKRANGNIFLFLDADIIFLPQNFLENLLAEFEKRKLDIASFSISIKGNKLDRTAYRIYNFWINLTQSFLPHATHALLVRKNIHLKIGGFDEEIKLGEDHAYARAGSKFGKFGFIKIEPAVTSSRRYERDGRIKNYLRYFLAGTHMFFFGNIKSDIFKYKFNHWFKKKKK
jgi:glycosyltransferase involved in cell wall biosynthesis